MTGRARFPLPVNSREAAFLALINPENTSEWASDRIHSICDRAQLSAVEHAFAYEMTAGCLRRRRTLRTIVGAAVARPLDQLEPGLVTLLCLGAYQLVFLGRSAPYAAVNETVAIAGRMGKPRWTSITNGVLRAVSRMLTGETSARAASACVPIAPNLYLQLNQPVFADADREATRYFAEAFSFPDELAQAWSRRYPIDQLFQLGFALNEPASVSIRINSGRSQTATLIDRLSARGYQFEPADVPNGWHAIAEPFPLAKTPEFQQGEFTIQDATAMRAACLLDPAPTDDVWDVCAAPGTKTSHLAELMGDSGRILATDISEERVARISENIRRLGCESITPRLIDPTGTDAPDGPFDALLLDVPCSNTGVLGKRPEARWRFQAAALGELNATQQRLADLAISRLKPGGKLVYSTCSIEPEENQDLVLAICRCHPEMKLINERLAIPGQRADGGYQALLVKSPE